jgi:hypothetical protein
MAPSSERRLLRPSIEACVQLDRVELLCVPAEPIPGCQRGLVQDGVPVVVAPSRRPDPDVTHASPSPALLPTKSCGGGYPPPSRLLTQAVALRSRPAGPEMQHPAISDSHRARNETEPPWPGGSRLPPPSGQQHLGRRISTQATTRRASTREEAGLPRAFPRAQPGRPTSPVATQGPSNVAAAQGPY